MTVDLRAGHAHLPAVPDPRGVPVPRAALAVCVSPWVVHNAIIEVDGDRAGAIRKAQQQLAQTLTDASVANGPAYGEGFGLVTSADNCAHLPGAAALFAALDQMLRS